MCIQTGKTVNEAERMRFETQEFYLKSEEEMRALFPDLPEAADNTELIAQKCSYDFVFGHYHLPRFQLPEGETDSFEYLKKLCGSGFERRYGPERDDAKKQLDYELDMIRQMGFVDYFLIVSDFIGYAKGQGIPVGPGRGKRRRQRGQLLPEHHRRGPDKVQPLFRALPEPGARVHAGYRHRFLRQRRGEVIDYVNRKYGHDHVAQIVTFGTMAARQAIRDTGRALDISYAECDAVAKQVPFALGMTLDEAMRLSKQLREMYSGDERLHRLIDTARALEGMPRHASTHAAGVVITERPVYEYVPLAKNDESVVTQYPMTTLEELGLLKMDFLGLRNLTVLEDAAELVRRRIPGFDVNSLPDDDAATFAMLSAGRTEGVFQLESAGMTGVCTRLGPKSIEDITAVIALYRPGPMDSIPKFLENSAQPGEDKLQAPLARADTVRNLRLHRLSGAGHRDLPPPRGLFAGTGGQHPPRDEQEKARGDRRRAPGIYPRRRKAQYPRLRGQRHKRGRGEQHIRRDTRLRKLRLQQGARRGLRHRGLPHGVHEVPPPARIHGRAAHQRARFLHKGGGIHRRVPGAGHKGPAAGRETSPGRTSPSRGGTYASA